MNQSISVVYFACILILFLLAKDCVKAHGLKNSASEFSRHSLVQPIVHHARTRREITTTRHTDGHHLEVTVSVNIDGEDYILDLLLNKDLVTKGHIIQYQENGKTVQKKPSREELDICQYSGTVRDKENSWVALSTCHGLRGVIFDGKKIKHIEPAQDNKLTSYHFVYDHGDLKHNFNCGYSGGVTNNTNYDPLLLSNYIAHNERDKSRITRYKRATSKESNVLDAYNANENSRYVELVLVVDHRGYQTIGSLQLIHRQMKDVANIINSLYAPLNIFIALVGVVVWTERDEISLENNVDLTLTNFLNYRKIKLLHEVPNDNAHLVTQQKFTDGVVGQALKGPICTYEFSGGVATNYSSVIGLIATTIAHSIGHNFGMQHDVGEDCDCPDEQCIMSPSMNSVAPITWSLCSKKSLALAFERGMDYCLRNKPKRLFDSPTCGNGFVEEGEECDCGMTADKKQWNACQGCCDADTCTLRRNATCASGSCCNLETCRPKSAGTQCRAAHKECDLPEFCTGNSEFCPNDVHKMDTIPCGKNQETYCMQGSCRSRTDQCQLLWGTTGEDSHEKCYSGNNIKGNRAGNCGYDRVQSIYHKCSLEDATCGLLHCRHLNERLEFGMESVAVLSTVLIQNNGTIIPCRTAVIDLGLSDVDPGLVPDGAKCGDQKMCYKQRCVPIQQVRDSIAAMENSECPSDCSGHGVCNSKGHCHCDLGFSSPKCELPGPGGSIDSGPDFSGLIEESKVGPASLSETGATT
ncbi:zinc metalloproteinase-disintegrin-like crotastatin [Hyposmocoma kahamanoa]|uniref:zinc metalloproteinase-disintegrin-like crotastatin n=1 Tax=Hyposmocoma kahamanoa TaxID=1477025 RepID=UPI000E6D7223|nr:zinc metalloproteinase-disintegrin-like crotastatin [Hyposmocoma kahamanoa]